MTITLTADLEKFVAEQLKSGSFQSAEDVIAQSLGMLRAQEHFIQSNRAELREKIEVGLKEIRDGDVIDGKESIRQIRQKLRLRERDGR